MILWAGELKQYASLKTLIKVYVRSERSKSK